MDELISKKEATYELAKECLKRDNEGDFLVGTGVGIAKEIIDGLQPKFKWIPMKEHAPEKHSEEYIITVDDYVTSAQWDSINKKWYHSFWDKEHGDMFHYLKSKVQAWCEFLEPYEATDAEDS